MSFTAFLADRLAQLGTATQQAAASLSVGAAGIAVVQNSLSSFSGLSAVSVKGTPGATLALSGLSSLNTLSVSVATATFSATSALAGNVTAVARTAFSAVSSWASSARSGMFTVTPTITSQRMGGSATSGNDGNKMGGSVINEGSSRSS